MLQDRPLSFLSLLSKSVERIISGQTEELLYMFQSGFRKNCSTKTCLRYLANKIITGFEKGFFGGKILINLQKKKLTPLTTKFYLRK